MRIATRNAAAAVLDRLGLVAVAGNILNSARVRGPLVRAVNYHGTPHSSRENFARHCQYYARRFQPLSEGDLPQFLSGHLALERVGLLLTFDDGLRSNYRVAAALLDDFEFKGIFFVPVAFIETASESADAQRRFYGRINTCLSGDRESAEDYEPMSWEDLRDLLRRGHAVGSHTTSHTSLGKGIGPDVLRREVVDSKRILEERLGQTIRSFCWPFGRMADYSRAGYELVRANYQFAFTTFAGPLRIGGSPYVIHRSNVESNMSLARVKAATQGMTELYFLRRRRQFEQRVSAD